MKTITIAILIVATLLLLGTTAEAQQWYYAQNYHPWYYVGSYGWYSGWDMYGSYMWDWTQTMFNQLIYGR
jgi:hypothetical protein